ncbi:ATP-NAD kinase [Romboutsia weinsteinii]|uniref:ATP-NAD kinase n=1 Tax=Romboutsia weinsteinii TaxID=2020949 RepID=A0A371J0G3_9FIRM|nr:ATP-NAD kinase family protein [Romboutsia weinsteinii]RDY26250.1 ATP-NAD kinase [Romboutsia weinsteinii]
MIEIGLIVNPIAGMGGSVGLKGTDGEDVLNKAISLGSKPKANIKAKRALEELFSLKKEIKILTCSEDMGENEARELGYNVEVIFNKNKGKTSSEDTISACKLMIDRNIKILLFVGGDGTARDIYKGVGDSLVTIGIPAGVKIHSPVYAINPKIGGETTLKYIKGNIKGFSKKEVVDIDEAEYRLGKVNTKLYGYLNVPNEKRSMQNKKAPTPLSEEASQRAIGLYITDYMKEDVVYIIGPGTTTRAVLDTLNLESTLLGVDIIKNKRILRLDANENDILQIAKDNNCKLVITPTGGQGYLLGRGNQQISANVIREVGRDNIIVVSTLYKLQSLKFQPLYVDTFSEEVDNLLNGYMKIVVGYKDEIVYPVRK